MWAARVWWMLRAFDFDAAALLDGGFEKGRKEGRRVTSEPCAYSPPARFELRPELTAERAAVLAAMAIARLASLTRSPSAAAAAKDPAPTAARVTSRRA